MALSKHDTSMTYSVNVLEFWNVDGNGVHQPFPAGTVFTISRIDNEAAKRTFNITATAEDNGIRFTVDLSPGTAAYTTLFNVNDSVYDYKAATFDHVYSLKSGEETYLYGRLNLLKVA
jgi:hypothetical protein